jgi:hypothetical protein
MRPAKENRTDAPRVEPLRFDLTAERTARSLEWAAALQLAYFDTEVCGPAEITISFRLTGAFGTEIVARRGSNELLLQAI